MTDRVDDLESEIAELRAAVNGLTEELVETKARVRELEDNAEADRKAAKAAAATETTVKSDDRVEVVEHNAEAESTETESETNRPSEPTDETNDGETEQGDIIVA